LEAFAGFIAVASDPMMPRVEERWEREKAGQEQYDGCWRVGERWSR
jgi:hypothetical protein